MNFLLKALINLLIAGEDVLFDFIIAPILVIFYGLVKGTRFVDLIDHILDRMAEFWPPKVPTKGGD
jgi:hypothetical protein